MSDLNPGKHPFIPRRGYKLDSTRERELESERNELLIKTEFFANKCSDFRNAKALAETRSDGLEKELKSKNEKILLTRKKKSTPVSIESFKELNLKFDAVIAEFEKEKKTLIDINAKLHARIVELEHDKKATDARIRNLVEENGDLYFDVSLQNKENDTRFAKLEQTQDRIISFFSNNQSTPVSIESNLKPLTAELKKQLTPVSIESFKKKLDSILDAVIAEFEKGDGIYCFNNIMEPIVDINRALTDVNIALIDVNAKPYAGFKALENDDREYDERLLEYKERLQENNTLIP
ncbi:5659_t:CDS:2 [Entrophospora sp. SA101]|nr:5659_t:CDS:2 [Entrophospora sp. SA101]